MMRGPLLDVEVSVSYKERKVLDAIRMEVGRGEVVGVVGESGAGKSTLAAALMRVEHLKGAITSGRIALNGLNLMDLGTSELRKVRGRAIGLIHQSAATSLNPALTLERHMKEAWFAHSSLPWKSACSWVEELMASVGLDASSGFLRRYPGQVSGGQAQRFLICMAVLHKPAILIGDEPNSAVDAINRAEIICLLKRLNTELGMSVLLISHDLLSVSRICSRVYVLHQGKIIEQGPTADVLTSPAHPFTHALVNAWTGVWANRVLSES